MAKKKKNKHSKRKAAMQGNSAQAAQAHMDAGRFRQAVDVYKILYKNGQDQFLPQLKAAYEGLYRQRLAKDQFEQAAMVLDQLEKHFPGTTCLATVTLHLNEKNYSKAATAAVDLLQQQQADQAAGGSAAELADALVLAFEPKVVTEKFVPEIRRDLQGIWAALECITTGRYDQARVEIKPIGIRSIFVDWKWFVKGLGFFYEQQDPNAVRAFEKIRPNSVPGRAAIAYLKLLQSSPWCEAEAKNADLMEKAALIAGYGPQAAALARAEYLWQVNRLRDSLNHLQSHLDNFPTDSRGLMRTLTELYYNICFDLPPQKVGKYLVHLQRSVRQSRHAGEKIWAQRTVALFSEKTDAFDPDILDLWESFLQSYSQLNNGNSRLARSLVFKRLGDLFAEESQRDDDFYLPLFKSRSGRLHMRNPELAEYCYEESIEADPEALAPQLGLAAFLEKTGDDAALNRLLDQLIRQFPDEKNVLAKAGVRCCQRNAYVKAMKYLERALALDPMDHMLSENFIVTVIKAAVAYSRKGNATKARALLPRALETADRQSDDFNRGAAYLYARWAAMERLLGNAQQAESFWQQAVALHLGTEFKLHLFYQIIAASYGVRPSALEQHRAEVRKALKASFNSQTAVDGVQVLQYVFMLPNIMENELKLITAIEDYLEKGATHAMTKEQAGAIVAYLISPDADRSDIAHKYVKHWLRSYPDDALFRYWRFLIKIEDALMPMGPGFDPNELQTILRLAREQREMKVVAAVQKMLNKLSEMDNFFDPLFFDDDDDDDYYDDDDDDYYDDDDNDYYDDDDDYDEEEFFIDEDDDDDDDDPFDDQRQVIPVPLSSPEKSKGKNSKSGKQNPKPKPPEQLKFF